MTRQFFVGGNYKMNPINRVTESTLVGGLNSATLDPKTGA